MKLLCHFAHRFPCLAAEILERDRHKRRNFREETITDILMAGLVPFDSFGISTNYPADESLTGEDMDWEFVNEHATDGRKYLRLHIQAKRAHQAALKRKPYWLYRELDHAVGAKLRKCKIGPPAPKPAPAYGSQHSILVDEARKVSGCVPLYMFYHPRSALESAAGGLPAVEGVNWMFADLIPKNVTPGRWPSKDKRVDKWRPYFHPLSDLLCFDHGLELFLFSPSGMSFIPLLRAQALPAPTPGEVVDRLNARLRADNASPDRDPIQAATAIPEDTAAIIRAVRDGGHRAVIARPRVIFMSRQIPDEDEKATEGPVNPEQRSR